MNKEYVLKERTRQNPRKSLPDKEFKIMVLKKFTKFGRRKKCKKLPNGSHRAEEYKTKLKNMLEGFNNRLFEAEERISELKNRAMELTSSEQQKEKNMDKIALRKLCDIEWTNIHIEGITEGEKRENSAKKLFGDIMADNFPNLGEETDIHI